MAYVLIESYKPPTDVEYDDNEDFFNCNYCGEFLEDRPAYQDIDTKRLYCSKECGSGDPKSQPQFSVIIKTVNSGRAICDMTINQNAFNDHVSLPPLKATLERLYKWQVNDEQSRVIDDTVIYIKRIS